MAIDSGKRDQEPDIEDLLHDLEHRIERLRVLYEQYFMGIERMEPHTARKDVSRKLLELQQKNLRNTAIRYRFNALNQKFNVYQTYWNRTLRAIENGTYIRDVARAGRDALRRGVDIPEEVLRAMPERMREKILEEREALAKRAQAKKGASAAPPQAGKATGQGAADAIELDADDFDSAVDGLFDQLTGGDAPGAASAGAGKAAGRPGARPAGADEDEFNALFDQLTGGGKPEAPAASKPAAPAAGKPGAPGAGKPSATPPASGTARPSAGAAGTGVPPSQRPAANRPPPPPGVDEASAQALYKRYIQAKRLLGEKTDHIKYEHVVATLARQAPAIMKKHGAKGVDFSVVIKDDKVILKATPKK